MYLSPFNRNSIQTKKSIIIKIYRQYSKTKPVVFTHEKLYSQTMQPERPQIKLYSCPARCIQYHKVKYTANRIVFTVNKNCTDPKTKSIHTQKVILQNMQNNKCTCNILRTDRTNTAYNCGHSKGKTSSKLRYSMVFYAPIC